MRVLTALAAASLLASTAAPAVTVTFGGQTGIVPNQANTDPLASTYTAFTDTTGNLTTDNFYFPGVQNDPNNPCFSNSVNIQSQSGVGSVGFYPDSYPGVRLKPKEAGTCYAVVNENLGLDSNNNPIQNLMPGSVSINGTGGLQLTYAGFLWGSPDSYNYVKFLDENMNEISSLSLTYKGNAIGSGGTLTGADVYKQFSFTSDPGNAGDQFINFQFTKAEKVFYLELGNTGNCCFEFTNYADTSGTYTAPTVAVAHTSFALAVSEPGAAFALAAGLGMFGLTRRKRA